MPLCSSVHHQRDDELISLSDRHSPLSLCGFDNRYRWEVWFGQSLVLQQLSSVDPLCQRELHSTWCSRHLGEESTDREGWISDSKWLLALRLFLLSELYRRNCDLSGILVHQSTKFLYAVVDHLGTREPINVMLARPSMVSSTVWFALSFEQTCFDSFSSVILD